MCGLGVCYRRAVDQGWGCAAPQAGVTPCGLEWWLSGSLYFTQSPLVPCPTVRQYADICLFSTAQYKCPVAQLEQE